MAGKDETTLDDVIDDLLELLPDDETIRIDLARDFSPTPGGRYRSECRNSAEEFREGILLPALRKLGVIVDLDGVVGLPPSFAEEAFGGAVRALGQKVTERLVIVAEKYPNRRELAERMVARALDVVAEYDREAHDA